VATENQSLFTEYFQKEKKSRMSDFEQKSTITASYTQQMSPTDNGIQFKTFQKMDNSTGMSDKNS
jgi:hypothetical protein